MAEHIKIGRWVHCKSGDQVTEEESLIHALLLLLCSLCKTARSSFTRYLMYLGITNIFVTGTAYMFFAARFSGNFESHFDGGAEVAMIFTAGYAAHKQISGQTSDGREA